MHKIKLENKFDLIVDNRGDIIIALQSGQSIEEGFDSKLLGILEHKIGGFLDVLDKYITIPSNATILDIGAGNSLFDIAIAKHYSNLNLNFILVDGDKYDFNVHINKGSQHGKSHKPYNIWAPVFNNIKLNELDVSKFKTVNPYDSYWADDNSCDIVMSTSSWGWHYPIKTYLEKAYNLLKPGGYLIIRPFLNRDGYLKEVNHWFGKPIQIKKFSVREIYGSVKYVEEQNWIKIIRPTDEDHIMFYHAIWQKPLTI